MVWRQLRKKRAVCQQGAGIGAQVSSPRSPQSRVCSVLGSNIVDRTDNGTTGRRVVIGCFASSRVADVSATGISNARIWTPKPQRATRLDVMGECMVHVVRVYVAENELEVVDEKDLGIQCTQCTGFHRCKVENLGISRKGPRGLARESLSH